MTPVMWPRMRDDYEPGSANPGQSLVKSSAQDAWEPGAEPGGGSGVLDATGQPSGHVPTAQGDDSWEWAAQTGGGGGAAIQVGGSQPSSGWWLDTGATVGDTPVTPATPTADDNADTITWTPTTGVEYVIGGTVRTSPYNVGDVDATVTVTAQAASGYVLQGTSSWSFTFTSSGTGDTPVTATGPTWTDDTTNGGGTWTTPTETGITYSPASGTAGPGQSVTVTATAQTGYVLQGTTSWQHTFPTGPVVVTDAFTRADTGGGGLGTTDTGQTWTDYQYAASGSPGQGWCIASNHAQKSGGATSIADVDYVADVTVSCDIDVSASTTAQGGIVARHEGAGGSTPSNTFYHARSNPSTGKIQLYAFLSGSASLLAEENYPVTPPQSFTLSMTVSEGTGQTDIVVKVDGATLITYSDTGATRPTGTRVGMRAQTPEWHFDNFSAVEA